MGNLLVNLQLTKLHRVGRVTMKDKKGGDLDCLVIPIKLNHLFVSNTNEVYLSMVAWEANGLSNGQTHLLKPSVPKEVFDSLTDEQKKSIPIVGNVRPRENKKELESYTAPVNDLPFD